MLNKTKRFYKTCDYCGNEVASRGYTAHSRACARLNNNTKKVTETRAAAPLSTSMAVKSITQTPFWSVDEMLRVAYGVFQKDSALCLPFYHMQASQHDNQVENLTIARNMLNLKIEALSE